MRLEYLSQDILLHVLFPYLNLGDIRNLIEAIPALEPLANSYRSWGDYFGQIKSGESEPMTFRKFYDRFQGIYIWGYLHQDSSMASWIGDRPFIRQLEAERGPLVFSIKDRTGIFRSQYGFDIMRPLRLDFNLNLYCAQIGVGCYLLASGDLHTRSPGGGINNEPEVTGCKPGSLRQYQWGSTVEQNDGTTWTILPQRDVVGEKIHVFKLPFPNRVSSTTYQADCVWMLAEDIGIVSCPYNYAGGSNWSVVWSDFPEKPIWMNSMYRKLVSHDNVGEKAIVYYNTVLVLGESGAFYFLGPRRYADVNNGRFYQPMEWPHVRGRGHTEAEGQEMILLKLATRNSPSAGLDTENPPIKQFVIWGYNYKIGVDEHDNTTLFVSAADDESLGPFVHTLSIQVCGAFGLGHDGYVYRLSFVTGEWMRVPGLARVKDLMSVYTKSRGQSIEIITTFAITYDGLLYQMGSGEGNTISRLGSYREAPYSPVPDASRIAHYIDAPGVSPRRREFVNPCSLLPKPVNLPGFIQDISYVYIESLTMVALVKPYQVDKF